MSAGDWKDMYAAAVAGDLALVRHHISAGVNPNYQHPEILCTPLVASLIHGHSEIAHYLLAHGADPQLKSDFDDMTPLQAARRELAEETGLDPAAIGDRCVEVRRDTVALAAGVDAEHTRIRRARAVQASGRLAARAVSHSGGKGRMRLRVGFLPLPASWPRCTRHASHATARPPC